MGAAEAAAHWAERNEINERYRQGGLKLVVGRIYHLLLANPGPDDRRLTRVGLDTLVIGLWSGAIVRLALDVVEACAWCDGTAHPLLPGRLQPCEGCMGTGLAGRQRGAVAELARCPTCGQDQAHPGRLDQAVAM